MELFWAGNIRNYSFFKRLPLRFYIEVLGYVRTTNRGNWYHCKINGHSLHILSQVELHKEKFYLVEKVSPLEIRVVRNVDSNTANKNNNTGDNTVSFLA